MPGRVVLLKHGGDRSTPVPLREMLVTCAGGLQPFLRRELELQRFRVRESAPSITRCDAGPAEIRRANRDLAIASRILLPLVRCTVRSADEIYAAVTALPWHRLLPADTTFAISASTAHPEMRDHRFIAMRIKDAVVDRQRAAFAGRRSSIDRRDPAVPIVAHLERSGSFELSLDTSGRALHERGYRLETGSAPLRETVAAALVAAAWPPGGQAPEVMLDPFCGSGTIAIEAARRCLPRTDRATRSYAWQSWPWFRAALEEATAGSDSPQAKRTENADRPAGSVEERRSDCPRIIASDHDHVVVERARANARRAGVAELIEFRVDDVAAAIDQLGTVPRGAGRGPAVTIVSNPPYGERLPSGDLDELYARLGSAFRAAGSGWSMWLLTAYGPARRAIGLRAASRTRVYNGAIETELVEYHSR